MVCWVIFSIASARRGLLPHDPAAKSNRPWKMGGSLMEIESNAYRSGRPVLMALLGAALLSLSASGCAHSAVKLRPKLASKRQRCIQADNWWGNDCIPLIDKLAYDVSDHPTPKLAADYLLDACHSGSTGGCYEVARQQVTGELLPRTPQRGLMALARYCASKPGRCLSMNPVFFRADFQVDASQYADIVLSACRKGDPVACSVVLSIYARYVEAGYGPDGHTGEPEMVGVPDEIINALFSDNPAQALGKLCAQGSSDSCLWQAYVLRVGLGEPRDSTSASALLERLCQQSNKAACDQLDEQKRLAATPERASVEARCSKQDDARACALLGSAHLDGDFERQSFVEATHFFKRACKLGDTRSCRRVRGFRRYFVTPDRVASTYGTARGSAKTSTPGACLERE